MYIPPAFREERPEVVREIMKRFSFAVLVTHQDGAMSASHVPLLMEAGGGEHGMLIGHLARANEQWRHFREGAEALAIFQGPHAYISPSWYEAEAAVPTWNYVAIHAYGVPAIDEDPSVVRPYLETLVRTHEQGFERPWEVGRLPEELIRNLMRGIVFFRMPVRRLEAKFKLNQNRSEADRRGVVEVLAQSDDEMDRQVAELMRQIGSGGA
jgi:transcriptional regulator